MSKIMPREITVCRSELNIFHVIKLPSLSSFSQPHMPKAKYIRADIKNPREQELECQNTELRKIVMELEQSPAVCNSNHIKITEICQRSIDQQEKLEEEIAFLRNYGNKDCVHMADKALAEHRNNEE